MLNLIILHYYSFRCGAGEVVEPPRTVLRARIGNGVASRSTNAASYRRSCLFYHDAIFRRQSRRRSHFVDDGSGCATLDPPTVVTGYPGQRFTSVGWIPDSHTGPGSAGFGYGRPPQAHHPKPNPTDRVYSVDSCRCWQPSSAESLRLRAQESGNGTPPYELDR